MLVIDDDATLLGLLRTVVRSAGFNVLATTSPAKGLDMLRFDTNNVRVVVLDYNMPLLNGADALVYMRRLKPRIRIIGLTGIKGEDLPDSYARGVDRLITKPCTNSHLVTCIRVMLGGTADPSAS